MNLHAPALPFEQSLLSSTANIQPVVLRDFQARALDMLRAAIAEGHRRIMLMMPTGTGKTEVAVAICEGSLKKGRRAGMTVPMLGLVNQTAKRMWTAGVRDIGVLQADHEMTNPSAPIQVISLQTLRNRTLDPVAILLVDEAHVGDRHLEEMLARPEWSKTIVIGLSATPWTAGLGKKYSKLIIPITMAEAIAKGWLVPYRVFAPTQPDLSAVKTKAGDYQQDQLSEVMQDSRLIADVVESWQKHAENRPTLVFGVDRAHAKKMQGQFERAGIRAGYCDAFTSTDDREALGDLMATVEQIKKLTVIGSEQGLDQVKAKLDGVAASQQKVATASETMSKSTLSAQRDFDRLSKTIDPVARATAQLENAQRIAARAISENSGNADQASRNMFIMKQRLDQAIAATQQHSNVVAMNAYQMRNLGFQVNDAATMLLSGSSAFQVFATQGGQVYQTLQGPQGVTGSIKQLGSTLLGLVTPARVAMVGIAAIGAAGFASWATWESKIRDLERSLNGLGRASGQTLAGMTDLAARGTSRGLTSSQSFAAVGGFAGAGIDGGISDQLLASTRKFSGAFGLGISEATEELTKAFRDPVQGAQDLGRRFGTFGANVEQQIRRQAAMNDMEGARATLMRAYLDDLNKTKDATGLLAKAMEAASQRASKWFSWAGSKIDSGETQSQVDLNTLIENRRRTDPRNRAMISRLDREIASAQEQRIMEAGAPLIAPALADRAADEQRRRRQQAIDLANANVAEDARIGAAAIMARTSAEKLAVEQMKIEAEAKRDATRATTQAADADKARTLAIAEATRTLQDATRRINDEISMSGARTPLERVKRQTAIEFRDLGEQTNVLNRGTAPAATVSNRSSVAGTQGLADDFRTKLEALIAAVPGISITSGKRSYDEQADLYRRKPGLAAPPGRSNHEYGLAADLAFATPEARAAAHAKAGDLGLRFPMSYEPWHVEPFGARALRNGAPSAVNVGGNGANDNVSSLRSKVEADRINNLTAQMFFDTEQNAEAQRRALDASAKSFGKSTEEIARSNEQIRLENEVRRQGITDLTAYRATIDKLAAAEGQLAAAREKEAERQQKTIAAMDSVRDSARDLISSPLKAIARGEKPGEALKQAGLRIGDKLIDTGTAGLTETLLGKNGKAGGGLFGDLLGGLIGGDKTTANMNVQAGNVIVNGGIGGLGGGGGGGGLFSSLFGGGGGLTPGSGGLYALGAAFSRGSVVPFAAGGLTTGPVHFPMAGGKTGLMGEAGTEAVMPLKRGADGKLGVAASLGRASNDNGGGVNFHAGTTQLIVNGNVGNETMPKIQDMLDQHADRIEASVMKNVTRNLAGVQTANAARYAG